MIQKKGSRNIFLNQLKKEFNEKTLIINDEYQRKFIWPIRYQRSLIISIFKDYPIGSLIIRTGLISGQDEIVDGQQRVTTILNFINNKLNLNSTHGYEILKIIKEKDSSIERKNYYSKKKGISKFSDLMDRDQRWFVSDKSIFFETIEGNDEIVKEFFTLIQNQEKIKAGEITSNFPSLDIEKYFNYEKLDEIFQKIKFNNSRKEIIKLLIANFGYSIEKINIGVGDEKIINFAKKIDQKNDLKEIENLKNHIEKAINFLIRIKNPIKGKAKKRFIKLLLLIINRIEISDNIDYNKINDINESLSEFNGRYCRDNPKSFERKIINKYKFLENNYNHFVDLFYLFQGEKDIRKNINTIDFWKSLFLIRS